MREKEDLSYVTNTLIEVASYKRLEIVATTFIAAILNWKSKEME